MSLGHARPKLTHMPHLVVRREEEAAARAAQAPTGRTPEHACEVCGRLGSFGFNNFRHAPELAVFSCLEHRAVVEASLL